MPLKIIRNDITKVDTVAIVNTASRWCEPGAGCDIAIHNAAGYDELLNYRKKHIGAKEEGEAFITPGFKLPAKYIIHVVSPLFIDGTEGEEDKLRACYRNALDLAVDNDISSISFPLIATGSFGYPKADALRVAMDEINAFILNHELDVNIVVFDSTATAMAQKLYPQLEAFIDHNYVCEKREEEYGDPYFGSIRSESDEYDPYKSMFHRLDALVKPGVSSRRKASENEPKDATIPTLGSPVTCGLQNVLADKAEEDYEDAALVEADEDIFDESEYEDELEDSPALKERLLHLQDTFGEYLFYLIDIKGYSSTEVQNRAWITKSVYSKIKTTKKEYKPSKRIALQLCIGLKLNIDESIDILGRAGYAFSPCDKQDLIFRFFIENECYDILGISDALEKYGADPIVGF